MTQKLRERIAVAVFDAEPEMERLFRHALPAARFSLRFFRRQLKERDALAMRNAAVLVVFVHSRVGKAVLEQMPKLRLIATCSTGYDHIDLKACQQRNVAVVNVPSYGEDTVAEFTFALLLAVTRRIREAAGQTRAGNFSVQNLRGFDLTGKTIGVIGCGKIGMNVIRIARGFRMRVLAYDPFQKSSVLKKNGALPAGLTRLVRTSDVITLHTPLNPNTYHVLNTARFRQMRAGVVIVNTARGGLIDTNALFRALQQGTVRYAGLDVFEGEETFAQEGRLTLGKLSEQAVRTVLEDHLLLHDDRVLMTPHLAFNTHEAVQRIYSATAENIRAFWSGKPRNRVPTNTPRTLDTKKKS